VKPYDLWNDKHTAMFALMHDDAVWRLIDNYKISRIVKKNTFVDTINLLMTIFNLFIGMYKEISYKKKVIYRNKYKNKKKHTAHCAQCMNIF